MTGRKPTWTPEQDARMQCMKAKGYTHADIAERFCVRPNAVRHRLTHLKQLEAMRKPQPEPKPAATGLGAHLEGYHRARRGFHVPLGKRDQYFALLTKGVSVAVAAQKLGLMKGEGA